MKADTYDICPLCESKSRSLEMADAEQRDSYTGRTAPMLMCRPCREYYGATVVAKDAK